MQKGRYSRQKPLHAVTENDSSDSGDSLMIVELDPTENDTINTIHQPDIYKSRIFFCYHENKRGGTQPNFKSIQGQPAMS
jgi:hypothetical protein